jgi:thiol:disulfide interchange protein
MPGAHLEASVVVDQKAVPAGAEGTVAVVIEVDAGWHIQSAVPAGKDDALFIHSKIEMQPVEGITWGEVKWQVGEVEEVPVPGSSPLKVSLYRDKVMALVPMKVAADAAAGERAIKAKLLSQACNDADGNCVAPVTTRLTGSVTIGAAGAATTPANADVFAAAAKLKFYPPAPTTAASHPAATEPSASAPAHLQAAVGSGVTVRLMKEEEQLAEIERNDYKLAREETYSVGLLVIFALVGGMILNIMPCVLPVIPLKVLSLVQQAHGDRKKSLMHALAFSAGIVALFVALGAVLRGFGVFYGAQFQSEGFLTVMSCIVLALALSMLGVWYINPPQAVYAADAKQSGYVGSFMSGLLATLLATPCSAPYLGPVLAWALVQPMWVTMLGLALVGVGMAAPYVVLAVFPAALSKIPSAGRWSELLKQFLGIVMIGVAVYLMTRLADPLVLTRGLFVAVLVAGASWGWGQIPLPTAEPGKIRLIRAVVVVIAGLLIAGIYVAAPRPAAPAAAGEDTVLLPDKSDGKTWLPFNMALVKESQRQGRPVVIDWTADWCINCRVVEATVLDSEAVQRTFVERNAVLLRADLTNTNRPAETLNQKLKGQSIPVLAIFSPSKPTRPVVLRDLYSGKDVTDAVKLAN